LRYIESPSLIGGGYLALVVLGLFSVILILAGLFTKKFADWIVKDCKSVDVKPKDI